MLLPALALLITRGDISADEAEEKAITALKKLDAEIKRDEKRPGKPVVEVDLTFVKTKTKGFQGKLVFVFVELRGNPKVTDAELEHLRNLKQLQKLDLEGTFVTDAGLANLKDLKQLQLLNLGRTKLTDDGLAILKDIKQLQYLGSHHPG